MLAKDHSGSRGRLQPLATPLAIDPVGHTNGSWNSAEAERYAAHTASRTNKGNRAVLDVFWPQAAVCLVHLLDGGFDCVWGGDLG